MIDQSETKRWACMSVEEADSAAWQLVQSWHMSVDVETIYLDFDFAMLSQWLLWDKVARAVRDVRHPDGIELERSLLGEQYGLSVVSGPSAPRQGKRRLFRPGRHRDSLTVYAPDLPGAAFLLDPIRSKLTEGSSRVNYVSTAVGCPHEGQERAGVDRSVIPEDIAFAAALAEGVSDSFVKNGLAMCELDQRVLQVQVEQLVNTARNAEHAFDSIQPDVLLLQGDNFPPPQVYLFAARKRRIPTVVIQHGLDCEIHHLGESHGDLLLLWGEERKRRYEATSSHRSRCLVTGNSRYDGVLPVQESGKQDGAWLWVTRPHIPEKCYAVSRSPREGMEIFDAIVEALRAQPAVHLLIKPHPRDYDHLYRARIDELGLSDSVKVVSTPVDQLLDDVSVVISEDTTAGMEAIFRGKTVVHAHLAESGPVLPFVDYGAALPGFSHEELVTSLKQASQLESEERRRMVDGRRAFIEEFAGKMDGQAASRCAEAVLEEASLYARRRGWRTVFILPDTTSLGGVSTWSMATSRRLRQTGCDARVLAHGGRRKLWYRPAGPSGLITCPGKYLLYCGHNDIRNYLPVYRSVTPAVFVPNWPIAGYATCAHFSRESADKIRVIGYAHSDEPYYYDILTWYEPLIHAFVAVSEEIAQTLRERIPHRTDDIIIKPYGVDVLPELSRRESGKGPLRILYAGRIEEKQKRITDLPEAARLLVEAGVDFTLRIVGDGPDANLLGSSLEALPDACRRFVQVEPPLPHSEMAGAWSTADICLMTSNYEGTSIAMLEAMAEGCVPVVSRVSGVDGVIKEGRNGYTFGIGDLDQLVSILAGLDADRERLRGLSHAAHETILEGYSRSAYAEWLYELTEKVRSDAPRPWPDDKNMLPPFNGVQLPPLWKQAMWFTTRTIKTMLGLKRNEPEHHSGHGV